MTRIFIFLLLLSSFAPPAHAGVWKHIKECVGWIGAQKAPVQPPSPLKPLKPAHAPNLATERLPPPESLPSSQNSYRDLSPDEANILAERLAKDVGMIRTLAKAVLSGAVFEGVLWVGLRRSLAESDELQDLRRVLSAAGLPIIWEPGTSVEGFPIPAEGVSPSELSEQVEFHLQHQMYLEVDDVRANTRVSSRKRGIRIPYFAISANGQIFSLFDKHCPDTETVRELRWETFRVLLFQSTRAFLILKKHAESRLRPLQSMAVGPIAAEAEIEARALAFMVKLFPTEKLSPFWKAKLTPYILQIMENLRQRPLRRDDDTERLPDR